MSRMCSYGYADFANAKDCKKALEGMNNADIYGRSIRLDLANSVGGGRDRGMSLLHHVCVSIYSTQTV